MDKHRTLKSLKTRSARLLREKKELWTILEQVDEEIDTLYSELPPVTRQTSLRQFLIHSCVAMVAVELRARLLFKLLKTI